MPVMIRIPNVPDDLYRQLKARAAVAGVSLSDYLLTEFHGVVGRPTLEDLRARLATRLTVAPSLSLAEAVRAERDHRIAAAPGHGAR